MPTVYRSVSSRVLAGLVGGICLVALVAVAVDEGAAGAMRWAPWLGLVAVIAWELFWRPRVEVDDAGVTLVNVLRTVRLPWPSITDIDTRWTLTLVTAYGRYGAWAAPTGGRHAGRAVSEREVRALPESERAGGGIRVGDSPRSPSGRAALAIRARWEALRAAGHLDDPRLEFDRPPVRWHVETVAMAAGCVALGLAVQLV